MGDIMNYRIDIVVTTSEQHPRRWKVVLTSRIETDITNIFEREYSQEYFSKAQAAADLVAFVGQDLNWA